jgi:hypothetical protein
LAPFDNNDDDDEEKEAKVKVRCVIKPSSAACVLTRLKNSIKKRIFLQFVTASTHANHQTQFFSLSRFTLLLLWAFEGEREKS